MNRKIDPQLIISIGIMLISLGAVYVSFRQATIMNKQTDILLQQTKANAWPSLSFTIVSKRSYIHGHRSQRTNIREKSMKTDPTIGTGGKLFPHLHR